MLSPEFPGRGRVIMRFNAAPVRDGDRVVGAITTVQDISGERLARQEQATLQRRLLATLNHELRTPLAALLGHAEPLSDAGDDPTDLPELVGAISRATWRLRDIVATVADLVELDSNQGERSRTDVDRLLRELVAEHPQQSRIAVTPDRPAPVHVDVDRCALHRAVTMLLDSALRESPDEEPVVLRLGHNDATLWVNVVDRRRRTAPEDRLGEQISPGLALLMGRAVAYAHGGDFRAETVEDLGRRVEVLLPRAAD